MSLATVETSEGVEESLIEAAGRQILEEAESYLYWSQVRTRNEEDLNRRQAKRDGEPRRLSIITLNEARKWEARARAERDIIAQAVGYRYTLTGESEEHPGLGYTFEIQGTKDGQIERLTASLEKTPDGISSIVYSGSLGGIDYADPNTAMARAKMLEPTVRKMYRRARGGSVKAPAVVA